MRWRRDRTRYTVWQVQGGHWAKIASGLTRKEAVRSAATVDAHLALFKVIAPSGPQDAHAVIRAETGRTDATP